MFLCAGVRAGVVRARRVTAKQCVAGNWVFEAPAAARVTKFTQPVHAVTDAQ